MVIRRTPRCRLLTSLASPCHTGVSSVGARGTLGLCLPVAPVVTHRNGHTCTSCYVLTTLLGYKRPTRQWASSVRHACHEMSPASGATVRNGPGESDYWSKTSSCRTSALLRLMLGKFWRTAESAASALTALREPCASMWCTWQRGKALGLHGTDLVPPWRGTSHHARKRCPS